VIAKKGYGGVPSDVLHGNYTVPYLKIWAPIALAGIGLNLWILWYLLVKWPGTTGQPLPLIGYVFTVVLVSNRSTKGSKRPVRSRD